MKVLFVCHGNICRSPTAEAVFAAMLVESKLPGVEVTSAGTISFHAGEPPDPRSQHHARTRGYDLSRIRAKVITPTLLAESNYILAMDKDNAHATKAVCPAEHRQKIQLFLNYAPDQPLREVPDPYYEGDAGFERVLDLVEVASRGLLENVRGRSR